MPDVKLGELGEAENVAALKLAAERSGWKRVEGKPQAEDILQMLDIAGSRHVAYMISTIRGLRVLHSDGHMTDHGPVGSTVCVTLDELLAGGYRDLELWRRA